VFLIALAAIFAAVPFLGTYIAAVPGFIELYIVKGQRVEAILLMILHLLPSSVVDSAIYSDIKGSGNNFDFKI
jgi:predicted PurR-regulated permease PerM